MNKKAFRDSIFAFNASIRDALEKHTYTLPLYERCIIPIEMHLFRWNRYKVSPTFLRDLDNAESTYLTDEERQDIHLLKTVEREMLKAHFAGDMKPEEYFLYGLRGKNYRELRKFLSDRERKAVIHSMSDLRLLHSFTHKGEFFRQARQFFHRDVCFITGQDGEDLLFMEFVRKHHRFIVKPIEGTFGRDAAILNADTDEEARAIYAKLRGNEKWIVEELIVQTNEMAAWNPTSVNTVRIPAFYTENGCTILQPFLRTGRHGAIIDNAGGGGIFAVFDEESGIITSDGVDEHGGRYTHHPDSGIRYKGWQVPRYDELKSFTSDLFHALPLPPLYLAFDMALTPDGWVVVEANTNGQFVGQIATHQGVRETFFHYIQTAHAAVGKVKSSAKTSVS